LVAAGGSPPMQDENAIPHDGEEAELKVPDADVRVRFDEGEFKLPRSAYLSWLQTAADAIRAYYRRFPVQHVLVKLKGEPGDDIGFATTGFEDGAGQIEIPIGEDISATRLKESWVAAHEMTHLAFPMVGHRRRWVAEGQATYIEPLARLQVGDRTSKQVWRDLVEHLPSGLPESGAGGLDGFHSIGRTYWGGALFFLLADIEIRKQTHNKQGLEDAEIAIVKSGGNAGSDWSIGQAFQTGDQAVHGNVLEDLDSKMATKEYRVDLDELWKQLGVLKESDQIVFDDKAPLAYIRLSIEKGKD